MTPSPPYSQLDELDAHLPDDVTEQVAKLAYLLQAELVEWQCPRCRAARGRAPRLVVEKRAGEARDGFVAPAEPPQNLGRWERTDCLPRSKKRLGSASALMA